MAEATRREVWLTLSAVAATVIAGGITLWAISASHERDHAILQAKAIVALCGSKLTDEQIQRQVEALHAQGTSWAKVPQTFQSLIGCDLP